MQDNTVTAKTSFSTSIDVEVQKKRQTEEWTLLAQTVRLFTVKTVVYLSAGIAALILSKVLFTMIGAAENNVMAICAVVLAVVAAVGISSAVTDVVLARSKRNKMLPRVKQHLDDEFDGLPSPCVFTAVFDDDSVKVTLGGRSDVLPLSDCTAVEFNGMITVDFGNFCGLCFTPEELGEACEDIKTILRERGERYQYLERDGRYMRLYDDETRAGSADREN